MSANTSIQAQQKKKLKKGATSQCLTSITKTEQHSIVLSPKPQNQLTVEKNFYPATSVTQSTSLTAKTTGPLISNTPDSPKSTKEHLVLVKSNYPAEQFTDKKKYLMFFYIMQFTAMYPDGDLYNKHGQHVGNFNGVWNEEYFKNKHRGKRRPHLGPSLQRLILRRPSKHWCCDQKLDTREGRTRIQWLRSQWRPIKSILATSSWLRHTTTPEKQSISRIWRNKFKWRTWRQWAGQSLRRGNRKNGKKKKKKKKSTLKRRDQSPIHNVLKMKKKKLTEEATDVDKKNREQEINMRVGQNQRETWTNLLASVSKHLKTCNEGTEIKPMKFKVLN